MPSNDNLNIGRRWISSHLDGGGTDFRNAIQHCINSNSGIAENLAGLKVPVVVEELTILVITDGEFNTRPGTDNAIALLQKSRRDKGLPEALIGFVGIKVKMPRNPQMKTGHTFLKELATKCGGLGYLRIEFLPEIEQETKEN